MIATPTIPTPSAPKLWDYAVAELQSELTTNLSWLTAAFGKAIRQQKNSPEGRPFTFPAVYSGTGDYLNMFPDGHLGNYCWLDVDDYQVLQGNREERAALQADVALVFWLDLRTAYPSDYATRTIENAKYDALEALRAVRLTRSAILIESVAERKENIYRGYDFREVADTFIMSPFAAFRLEGEMIIREIC